MRNLKRALSLALASVMVLGMMVVGAGAASYDDFGDKDKIANTEAVSVLVELNVINGKDDGNFDPEGIVTRAEMAKMICVVLNGGKDPSLGTVTNYTYTDTVGHWAAAYVEYCTNLGIVAGDGTGKFNPANTVTGTEAAKMLLVAAGYQTAIEGFTGANWAVSTNVRANQVGLYKGVEGSPSDGLTRDNAAQMVYNALSAEVVTYKYTLVADGKGGFNSVTELNGKGVTVIEDRFGAVKVEGIVLANEYGTVEESKSAKDGETYIKATNYGSDEEQNELGSGKYMVSTGKDELGKSVTLYVKPGTSSLTNKATVMGGVIVSDTNVVVTLTSGSTSKTIAKRMSDEDLKLTDATYVSNYTEFDMFDGDDYTVNGVEITAIDNDDDGTADYVLQNFAVFGKVSSYNTKDDGTISVTAESLVNGYGFFDDEKYDSAAIKMTDFDDVIGVEDVEKDDYVLAQEVNGKLYVTKVEPIELTPDSKQGDNFVADGETYKQAGTVATTDGTNAKLSSAVELKVAASVYLDAYGYVVCVTDVDTTVNYLYVTASTSADGVNDVRAKAVLADGTTDTITVSKLNGDDIEEKDGKLAVGIYSYTTTTGGSYKLTSIVAARINAKVSGDKYIAKGNASLETVDGTKRANADTVFVVDNGNSWSVYTGIAKVPNLEAPADSAFKALVASKDNTAKFVVVTASNLAGSTALDKSIYFLDKDPVITGDEDVFTYSVIYQGEATTLKADSDLNIKKGLYLECTINSDDEITKVGTRVDGVTVSVADAGIIELDGDMGSYGSVFTVDDDTVILAVDGDDVTEVGLGYITVGAKGDYVVVIPDKDNTALAAAILILE